MLIALLVMLSSGATTPVSAAPCRAMAVTKGVGDIVALNDTVPAACSDVRSAAGLRYDGAAKVVRARRDLAIGEPLGHAYLPERPAIIPGDRVMITARIGHVTIARPALALQAAEHGHRYFVRLDDGKIVVAPALAWGDVH